MGWLFAGILIATVFLGTAHGVKYWHKNMPPEIEDIPPEVYFRDYRRVFLLLAVLALIVGGYHAIH